MIARQGDRSVRKGLATKRRRRLMRRLGRFLRFVMVLVLAFGLYTLWRSPAWHWNGQMRITGNRLVTRQEILARLSVPRHTPLYRLDPRWIEAQLLGMPAIAHVAVRRWLFPARLDLAIIERQPLVSLSGPTPNLFIDQEGVVFAAAAQKAHFPVQLETGLQPGERLPASIQAPLFDLLTLWPRGAGGRIDLRSPHDATLAIDGWSVRLGELQDVASKLAMFEHLKALAAKYRNRLDYIDLRYPQSPTFRLKGGASIDAGAAKGASPAPSAAPSDGPPPDEAPNEAPIEAPNHAPIVAPPANASARPAPHPVSPPAKKATPTP